MKQYFDEHMKTHTGESLGGLALQLRIFKAVLTLNHRGATCFRPELQGRGGGLATWRQ